MMVVCVRAWWGLQGQTFRAGDGREDKASVLSWAARWTVAQFTEQKSGVAGGGPLGEDGD